MFGARSAKKAQDKENKRLLEEQRQQRAWDVEDRDKMRAFDLEDRAARQALLNPYAEYFTGKRLAKPAAPVAEPEAPVVAPVGMQRSIGGGRSEHEPRYYRTQQR